MPTPVFPLHVLLKRSYVVTVAQVLRSKVLEMQAARHLHGKRAVLTGAAGQLGIEFAKSLAKKGCNLHILDREDTDLLNLAQKLMKEYNIEVKSSFIDFEQPDLWQPIAHEIASDNLELNILVNNAAFVGSSELTGWSTDFENQTLETFRRALEVNLVAPFGLSQILYPKLKISQGANIVNIGSIYASLGPDPSLYVGTNIRNPAAYAASKGGLIQLTRWMSTIMAPEVRVNSISPGGLIRSQPQVFIERYENKTPLKRMGTESDICGALDFIVSDSAGYVTGQNLIIDGGWSTW